MTKFERINFNSEDKEIKASIEKIKRQMDDQLVCNKLLAKIAYSKYEEFIKVGFMPEEALELCRDAMQWVLNQEPFRSLLILLDVIKRI